MKEQFYQIKTEESFGNHYLKVFVDDSTFIDTVAALIQTLDCVKTVKIKEYVCESTEANSEAIEVCPDTGIRPCVEENFGMAISRIKNILEEIDDEVLEMRNMLSDHTDALKAYDRVIFKMVIGEYNNSLIKDMFMVMALVICDLTGISIDSSIELINNLPVIQKGNGKTDIRATAKPLYCATNTFIVRINEAKHKNK